MSEIYHRYQSGESIPSTDIGTDEGLNLYGEIIHFEWRADKATMQLGMDGEVYIQKTKPLDLRTPEHEHLIRVNDLKKPIV